MSDQSTRVDTWMDGLEAKPHHPAILQEHQRLESAIARCAVKLRAANAPIEAKCDIALASNEVLGAEFYELVNIASQARLAFNEAVDALIAYEKENGIGESEVDFELASPEVAPREVRKTEFYERLANREYWREPCGNCSCPRWAHAREMSAGII